MSDDLVKRLQAMAEAFADDDMTGLAAGCQEAAARIEALEAELDRANERFRVCDETLGHTIGDLNDAQRERDEARAALRAVKDAIVRADPTVLVCTLWMPMDASPAETVVDFIDAALGGKDADERNN